MSYDNMKRAYDFEELSKENQETVKEYCRQWGFETDTEDALNAAVRSLIQDLINFDFPY